jgi:hypothetical protein
MSVITGPVAPLVELCGTCQRSWYGNEPFCWTVSDAASRREPRRALLERAACCSAPAPVRSAPTTFAPDLTVRSSTVLQTGTEAAGQCRDFNGIVLGVGVGTGGFTPIGRIASAYSPALDQHIATWWDSNAVMSAIGLRFNTVSDGGVLGLRRDVYAGVSVTQDARARLWRIPGWPAGGGLVRVCSFA